MKSKVFQDLFHSTMEF